MIRYILKVALIFLAVFVIYACYDIYQNIGMDGIINVIDFFIHGK